MHRYKLSQLATSGACLFVCAFSAAAENVGVIEPVTQLGTHTSPDGRFSVILRQNGMGGGTDMFVMKLCEPMFYASDVTAYVWLDKIVIYSSLRLYGTGGIYRYDPLMETRSTVVEGKANEYFELRSFSTEANKLCYYYSDDLHKTDVAKLKSSKKAVREILLAK